MLPGVTDDIHLRSTTLAISITQWYVPYEAIDAADAGEGSSAAAGAQKGGKKKKNRRGGKGSNANK